MPMINHFTPNDLIRFLYRETSAAEDVLIKLQLSKDAALAAEFSRLLETVTAMDEVSFEPSETSVNLILEFSREHCEEISHA